jgi:hypothetical protein
MGAAVGFAAVLITSSESVSIVKDSSSMRSATGNASLRFLATPSIAGWPLGAVAGRSIV